MRGCRISLLSIFSVAAVRPQYPWHDGMIEQINGNSSLGWRAALNSRFAGYTKERASMLCGVLDDAQARLDRPPPQVRIFDEDPSLPDDFDGRSKWPGCIGEILDQGECGSCWAVAAAEAISDRLCIASSRPKHFVRRSALDLVSCDFQGEDMGCLGGLPNTAWQYAVSKGLATDKCLPYAKADGGPIPKCPANGSNPCTESVATPLCPTYCPNVTNSGVTVEDDRVRMYNSYAVGGMGEEQQIRAAIMKGGPVEASFYVFQDLLAYKSGIYHHATGENIGRHAIKIIGWGSSPEPYWLVANSWGTDWGDKGFFKIRRGTGECGIEEAVFAGDASASPTREIIV
eukprot:gnl/TRDRNA2_/TRDRNA2_91262_c0_seq1.p1 gnl/TRDRNA2_/TRDRNA2_91262_c0~~gnl/TRDRNA2_/TRDRNA2_91262_c0_seq1.p1  ORF type:complete len:344 (+),score=64.95 gnl/TRDRNA2_/TRDRNA2_91262_c0_seq1:84-1115(+)